MVSDAPDAEGVYTILWNAPPTAPSDITVSAPLVAGKSAAVAWGASTVYAGSGVGYQLEISADGGAFAPVYNGAARSFDAPVDSAWTSAQFRVTARDDSDVWSDYRASAVFTVVHNNAPAISGSDESLGAVTAPPSYDFSVDDADAGDVLSAEFLLDDAQIGRITNAARGQTYNVTLTDKQFFALRGGAHTLKIVCADPYERATRAVTFSRTAPAVEFQILPVTTLSETKKVLANIETNGNVQVLACNNALDDSPAWEPVTAGNVCALENDAKTADDWAFGLWVTITPSDSQSVSCSSVSGFYSSNGGVGSILALQERKIDKTEKGQAEGVAPLDEDGILPPSYLPPKVLLVGAFLSRAIGDITTVSKSLFPPDMKWAPDERTFVYDMQGTEGVIIDGAGPFVFAVRTTSISPVGSDEPTLLGNVATWMDMPLTQDACLAAFGRNAHPDDYARVIADESKGGATVEYYVTYAGDDGLVNWGNPVVINTSDYQMQTSADSAGKLLTGGAIAGAYGPDVDPGTFAKVEDLADAQTELTQEAAARGAADDLLSDRLAALEAPEMNFISLTVTTQNMPVSYSLYAGEAGQLDFGACVYVGVSQHYAAGPPDKPCSFCFHFASGDEPTELDFSLPLGGWLFAGGEPPQIEANKKYTCVVLFDGAKYRASVGVFG
jgi:hypothetical protein